MYEPAFLEIFVAFAVLVAWTRWLCRREIPAATRALLGWLPWVAGVVVVGGQLLAMASMAAATERSSETALRLLTLGRWGSALVTLAALGLTLGLTVRWFRRR